MIKILVTRVSPRIEYVFDFIFTGRGVSYELTESPANDIDFVYSSEFDHAAKTIVPSDFMFESTVRQLTIETGEFQGVECVSFDGIVDPVASIFFVLSRYEEYITHEHDAYDRFPLSASLLPKTWLEQAVCDRWAEAIIEFIQPNCQMMLDEMQFVPSFDIDNTYAYKLKEGKRKTLSVIKDRIRNDKARLQERKEVLAGTKDPYDTFDTILKVFKRYPSTKVFWLIGKWGKKDRNISIDHPEHQRLIRTIRDSGIDIGLHPSFGSFRKDEVIQNEKKQLEEICGTFISHSRQHFLRFRLPNTYQSLINVGFREEYSMGYAEHVGFRCGTARAHPWFDLIRNRVSSLKIRPFVYMDGTLREYMKLSIDESKQCIERLFKEVQRYGGDFIFIWHNETIGDYGNWKGWSEVLDFTLNLGDESK